VLILSVFLVRHTYNCIRIMHWLFSFLIFCSYSKMVGSIVSDLEVEALANVVAKLKIEVCLLTACSEIC
jgi:hypothetical protein